MNNFLKNSESAKNIFRFYIGETVQTPDGIGIIVELKMPHNGLYIEPDKTKAVVWYSTDNAVEVKGSTGLYVTRTYNLNELNSI